MRILTDRLGPEIPLSRRLRSTSDSKLLIFMTVSSRVFVLVAGGRTRGAQ